MRRRPDFMRWLPALVVCLAMTACGLGGDDSPPEEAPADPPIPADLWAPAPDALPAQGGVVYLESQAGDYVGGGRTLSYTLRDAQIELTADAGLLHVSLRGDTFWDGDFQLPASATTLRRGYFAGLTRFPFHDAAVGGLSWGGDGRGCNMLTGWFAIDHVRYVEGKLDTIDLRFEQHCEGGAPALHGRIRWSAAEVFAPPGPQKPPPAELWRPPDGAVPANGSYAYLASEPGDYVGGGATQLYTTADAVLTATADAGKLALAVQGDQQWTGTFWTMASLTQLQPGYYAGLTGGYNPVRGFFSWGGEGRGCGNSSGWVVVDEVSYAQGQLASVALRFEQRCNPGSAVLHGAWRWSAADAGTPPGPQNPPPANLWSAPANAVPASGNYVYLASEAGDYIGQGRTTLLVAPAAPLAPSAIGRSLSVTVADWSGHFEAMLGRDRIEPGWYAGLHRWPFHNPARGGLDWSGEGRGCNELNGWFAVDEVSYAGEQLRSIQLRFEQVCEGFMPPLHGQIRWSADG